MNDGFLSQEEIDALLRGDSAAAPPRPELTPMENDAIGEIGNISMGSAATTLSILLGRRVSITTPRVSISSLDEIKQEYPLPYLVIEVGYTQGIVGTNLLAMRERDALIIADLMMGNDGSNPPEALNELYMSAVGEAMNQMMGSTSTSMSTMFKTKIDIAPPKVNLVDFAVDHNIADSLPNSEPIVRVAFRMEVEDLIDSEIMQILSVTTAKDMVSNLLKVVESPSASVTAAPPKPSVAPNMAASPAMASAPSMAAAPPQHLHQTAVHAPQNIAVQPAQFVALTPTGMATVDPNIALLLDVPLQVTVELGRTRKLIRDILELSPGSVIELDKLAGEAVDILVNGKLIAKGEVVVIDENFGVRVTDIISQIERTKKLQ